MASGSGQAFEMSDGGMPERSNGAVSKTVVRASVPWVRIPLPPPAIHIIIDSERIYREIVARTHIRPHTPEAFSPLRSRSIFYFSVSALAAPRFGFAGALGAVPADAGTFFLSALGFLASRLLLF
jgi:hypothetical protein